MCVCCVIRLLNLVFGERNHFFGGTRMIRMVAFVPLASLFLLPILGDESKQKERPAAELLSAGVAKAKDQGKRVFLLFGSPT
jgi:hypothetical protein